MYGIATYIASIITSIHALLAECDLVAYRLKTALSYFNPRTPRGVRHQRRDQ